MTNVSDCNNLVIQLQGLLQNIQTNMAETDAANLDMSAIAAGINTAITAANTFLTGLGSAAATDENV